MNINYTVFSAEPNTADTQAMLPGGQLVQAKVPSYVVQLTPVGEDHGTLRLTFIATNEIEEAKALFAPGKAITLSFAG